MSIAVARTGGLRGVGGRARVVALALAVCTTLPGLVVTGIGRCAMPWADGPMAPDVTLARAVAFTVEVAASHRLSAAVARATVGAEGSPVRLALLGPSLAGSPDLQGTASGSAMSLRGLIVGQVGAESALSFGSVAYTSAGSEVFTGTRFTVKPVRETASGAVVCDVSVSVDSGDGASSRADQRLTCRRGMPCVVARLVRSDRDKALEMLGVGLGDQCDELSIVLTVL